MLEKVSVKILIWIVLLNRDAFCEDFSDNGLTDQILHLILSLVHMGGVFCGSNNCNDTDKKDADARYGIPGLDY